MPLGDKSSNMDEHKQQAEPIEARAEKKSVGTKSEEARIWAAANQITRDTEEPFEEEQ